MRGTVGALRGAMATNPRELSTRIGKLEDQIEAELQRRHIELHADFENRKIKFQREVEAVQ